jgi:hypothetical protein
LRAQRLSGPRDADVVGAVRAVFAVQAQDAGAAFLAIRARTARASAEAVKRALAVGDLVRTWAMRGTLHLLAAADLPLALAVFGPLHLARSRRRLARLGLSDADAERSTAEAAAILAEAGPLTRHELAARLRDRGVPVAAEGQAPIHVVRRAALAGVLCEAGVSGAYGPLDVRLPDRDKALAELARRYGAAHAPATAADFAAWSGLPAAEVRAAWTEPPPVAAENHPGPARLLPAFDEWLLGWASRELVLPAAHARRVAPGGGIIRPVAIADGRVFATWRHHRGRVELEPFVRRPPSVAAEVAALSAFVGDELTLTAAG